LPFHFIEGPFPGDRGELPLFIELAVLHAHQGATPCVRFAAKVTLAPRNTRFRLVANLCRAGLPPAGSHQEFSVKSSFT
jgi:hypothetical protein